EIKIRVGAVLVVHEASYALDDESMQMRGIRAAYFRIEPAAGLARGRGARRDCARYGRVLQRLLESLCETPEARRDRHAAAPDRLLVELAREGQNPRPGQRTKQHRADDAAGLGRDRVHVEAHQAPRLALERREHRV